MKCTSRLTTLTNCLSNIVIWITNLGDHSLNVLYCTLKLRRAAGLEGRWQNTTDCDLHSHANKVKSDCVRENA